MGVCFGTKEDSEHTAFLPTPKLSQARTQQEVPRRCLQMRLKLQLELKNLIVLCHYGITGCVIKIFTQMRYEDMEKKRGKTHQIHLEEKDD